MNLNKKTLILIWIFLSLIWIVSKEGVFRTISQYICFISCFFLVTFALIYGLILLSNFLERRQIFHVSLIKKKKEQNDENRRANAFKMKGVAGIISILMKSDRAATKEELLAVSKYLKKHYNSDDYKEIIQLLKKNLKANNPKFINQACKWTSANMKGTEHLAFMEMLFDVARISKGIDKKEWELLHEIMKRLEIEEDTADFLSGKYSKYYNESSQSDAICKSTAVQSALQVLGLQEGATGEEIQKTYRTLAKKYHPDTVQDPSLKLVLTEKLKELNEAYTVATSSIKDN